MEIKDLDREVFNWRKINEGVAPFIIEISHESMAELMEDKELAPHVQQNVAEDRIIGYMYKGIPLAVTDDVKTYKFYTKEEARMKVK